MFSLSFRAVYILVVSVEAGSDLSISPMCRILLNGLYVKCLLEVDLLTNDGIGTSFARVL